ncbi:MAG: hypothetical protein SFV15_24030 [Polyangiaceae bacterium]|nr:hypothetical protein [Polyangiaceae bacterium]
MKKYNIRLLHDSESGLWTASWDKVGGGGVVAIGMTIESAMRKFRSALGIFLDDKQAAKGAVLIPEVAGLPKPLLAKLETAQLAKARADAEQLRAGKVIRRVVGDLAKRGLSTRDVGTLLGVSRQRAHKLLKAG